MLLGDYDKDKRNYRKGTTRDAKSLMLNDWVVNTEFGKNEIDRVECIEENRVWLEKGEFYTPINYIEPIPLTAEILEKNGFANDYEHIYTIATDFYDLDIEEISDSIWLITHYPHDVIVPSSECSVCYVHELQHALRLFGVNKEIEL